MSDEQTNTENLGVFFKIYEKSCQDQQFLEDLLTKPDRQKTLMEAGIELSEKELKKLDLILQNELNMKGKDLLRYLNTFAKSALEHKVILPPPPPWDVIIRRM